jgi:CxxC-x17-CxxC domain-containing protein
MPDEMSLQKDITFFAETTFRNERKRFGVKTDDRRRHIYIVGKTGMGKTVMLENMVIQDIQRGYGVGVVDPHGEFAEKILDFIPANRINDVIYFDPADLDFPIAFNIMEKVDPGHRHLVAAGLLGVFKKIWPDVWSARMEYILNNCILALLEFPGSTLLGINRMLADPEYRKKVVDKVQDPVIKAFWVQEYASFTQRYEVEAKAAIQNKVGQFISAPLIRNIIGQVKSTIDMRKIMDEGKILIMNLSKGRIGEENSRLLGALLITKIQLAAMSRVDVPEEKRQDFYLYVDEFQNFATASFVNILSEARKYRLSLVLAHQYITQMEEEVRDAVFGNVGTIVTFRVGAEDAEFLEKELMPEFTANDLVNLAKYNIYLKLMIDGVAGRPFSAETLAPFPKPQESNREKIIKVSRERYSTSRQVVEEKISRWSGVTENLAAPPAAYTSQQVLYDARCAQCGKWTKIIFPPDGKRPIYCKSCLKKVRPFPRSENRVKPKEENPSSATPEGKPATPYGASKTFESLPTISLKELAEKEPIPFSPSRKEKKRKEVDTQELKKVIEESLDKKTEGKTEKPNIQKGEIKPGETIKFT